MPRPAIPAVFGIELARKLPHYPQDHLLQVGRRALNRIGRALAQIFNPLHEDSKQLIVYVG